MNKIYQMNGYQLHLISSKKFKDITISVRFKGRFTRETVTSRSVLGFLMITGTMKHPTQKDLSRTLEDLYGANLSANISSAGKGHIITFKNTCVNQEFLPINENLLIKQVDLLNELLNHPYIVDGHFDEEMTELKKQEITYRIMADMDDKMGYAFDRMVDYMGRGSVLGLRSTGYIEDMENINAYTLVETYKDMIQNDDKHVYVVGDIDESIVSIFKEKLQFPEVKHEPYPSAYMYQNNRKHLLDIIEKQDIVQSKLVMGYKANCCALSDNTASMSVFSNLLGGYSQSRLFQVVREKNSLCYFIHSSYDPMNGIMTIAAGIDMNNYDKTKELIGKQIKDLQEGHITDEELSMVKTMLINALSKVDDDPNAIISFNWRRDIINSQDTIEDKQNAIRNVTKEDVIKCAQSIELDTIYFLTGKEFYEENLLSNN